MSPRSDHRLNHCSPTPIGRSLSRAPLAVAADSTMLATGIARSLNCHPGGVGHTALLILAELPHTPCLGGGGRLHEHSTELLHPPPSPGRFKQPAPSSQCRPPARPSLPANGTRDVVCDRIGRSTSAAAVASGCSGEKSERFSAAIGLYPRIILVAAEANVVALKELVQQIASLAASTIYRKCTTFSSALRLCICPFAA